MLLALMTPGSAMTLHVRFALAGVLAGISLVCAGAPVVPNSGSVLKVAPSSAFLEWSGGGPEYRIVAKQYGGFNPAPPANDTDGRVFDVGTSTRDLADGLEIGATYFIAIYGRENGVSSATALPLTVTLPQPNTGDRYADAISGADTSDCRSPSAPCKTISYAKAWVYLSTSELPVRTVVLSVAPGIYNRALGEVFPLKIGAYTKIVSTHGARQTIIDASGSPARRIMQIGYPSRGGPISRTLPAEVYGFTFRGGVHAAPPGEDAQGGALWVSGDLYSRVAYNVFEGNIAQSANATANSAAGNAHGGAVFVEPSRTLRQIVTDNEFRDNRAIGGQGYADRPGGDARGGGFHATAAFGAVGTGVGDPNRYSKIEFARNTVHANQAAGGAGVPGGAAAGAASGGGAWVENIDVLDNIFSENSVYTNGGGTSGNNSFGGLRHAYPATSQPTYDPFARNLRHGNTVMTTVTSESIESMGTDGLAADPLYIAPPLNLRFGVQSPAASLAIACCSGTDLDGRSRPTPASRGAYEPWPSAALAAGDLNGFGRSSLVFRNENDGRVFRVAYARGGTQNAANTVWNEDDLGWRIVEIGDFDGDGVSDLVWRNATTGALAIHYFEAGGIAEATRSVFYNEPRAEWKIVGTPDFDGDSKSDLLWRNDVTGEVWGMRMDGATIVSQGLLYRETNLDWRIVAVGDFSGTYKRNQLLWHNQATGQVYLQSVQSAGSTFTVTGQMIYHEPNTAWSIVATGDFDRDGKTDILWRNEMTGAVHAMLMDGGTIKSQATIYHEARPQWVIVGTGDYDGDYRSDILWRNTATGQVYRMRMDGLSIVEQGFVFTEPDLAWKLLGPATYPR